MTERPQAYAAAARKLDKPKGSYVTLTLPEGGLNSREVREEAGRAVIPESVREYGLVRRLEKGHREAVFEQENYYFFCEAEDAVLPLALDDYETEDGFSPEVIAPAEAAAANRAFLAGEAPEKCRREAERELRVLELLIEDGYF